MCLFLTTPHCFSWYLIKYKRIPLHSSHVRGLEATSTRKILNSRDATSGGALVHHVALPLDIPLQQEKLMESINCAKYFFRNTLLI
jgi:hypothetical protein